MNHLLGNAFYIYFVGCSVILSCRYNVKLKKFFAFSEDVENKKSQQAFDNDNRIGCFRDTYKSMHGKYDNTQ